MGGQLGSHQRGHSLPLQTNQDRLPLRSRRQWRQVAEDHGAAGDRVPH